MEGAAALAGGTAGLAVGCRTPDEGSEPAAGETTVASDSNAVVETTAGKVWGFTRNGIQTFKGIPTPLPPKARRASCRPPAEPWTETRSAMWYGKTCPQVPRAGWENDIESFLSEWDDGQPGEDCLRVNVWSPALDGKKRPVMFWIHGGGFEAGSGQEQPAYHGENLSRRGDVVVVSVNHRLGVLGFLDLADYGSAYAESANVGMLDLVAALEWVRDNIANFGGDPGNVTIFGQSGGGGKVGTLMTMPAAKGLFHKAVVESGSLLMANKPEDSAKLAAAVMAELGLSKAQIGKLHELPVSRLIDAGMAAMRKLRRRVAGHGLYAPQVDVGADGGWQGSALGSLRSRRAGYFGGCPHADRHRPERVQSRHEQPQGGIDDRRRTEEADCGGIRRQGRDPSSRLAGRYTPTSSPSRSARSSPPSPFSAPARSARRSAKRRRGKRPRSFTSSAGRRR